MSPNDPPPPPASRLRRLWRLARGTLVFLIVAGHLVFFAVRNPLDLWDKPIFDWLKARPGYDRWGPAFERLDKLTNKYANLVGCEQRFTMFSPPMAKGAPFLGYRLEFADGSTDLLRSITEPTPERFFRFADWRTRKLEDYLLWPDDDLAGSSERAMWEAYAREAARRWRSAHPDDPRELTRLVLVRRRIAFPTPEETPGDYDPPEETDVVAFDPQGKVLP